MRAEKKIIALLLIAAWMIQIHPSAVAYAKAGDGPTAPANPVVGGTDNVAVDADSDAAEAADTKIKQSLKMPSWFDLAFYSLLGLAALNASQLWDNLKWVFTPTGRKLHRDQRKANLTLLNQKLNELKVRQFRETKAFEEKIDALKQQISFLEKGKRSQEISEELRAKKAQLSNLLNSVKENPAPRFQIIQKIESLMALEEKLNAQLEEVAQWLEAAGSIRRDDPNFREAISDNKAGNGPFKMAEWLESEEGKRFLKSRKGKDWKKEYQSTRKAVASEVNEATSIYNKVIARHNKENQPKDHMPLLVPIQNEAGTVVHPGRFYFADDQYNLTPVARNAILPELEKACDLGLASLSTEVEQLTAQVNYGLTKRFGLSLLYSGIFGGLAFGSLKAYEYFFNIDIPRVRQAKAFKNTAKARVDKAKLDVIAELNEDKRLEIEEEKDPKAAKKSVMKPFYDIAAKQLHVHRDDIMKVLRDEAVTPLSAPQRKKLEEQASNLADLKTVRGRIETALLEVAQQRHMELLVQISNAVYGQKKEAQTTEVEDFVTEVYRVALRKLLAGGIDDDGIKAVQRTVFPSLIEVTAKDLHKVSDPTVVTPEVAPLLPSTKDELKEKAKDLPPLPTATPKATTTSPAAATGGDKTSSSTSVPKPPLDPPLKPSPVKNTVGSATSGPPDGVVISIAAGAR